MKNSEVSPHELLSWKGRILPPCKPWRSTPCDQPPIPKSRIFSRYQPSASSNTFLMTEIELIMQNPRQSIVFVRDQITQHMIAESSQTKLQTVTNRYAGNQMTQTKLIVKSHLLQPRLFRTLSYAPWRPAKGRASKESNSLLMAPIH